MRLIDTHCHLYDKRLTERLAEVLARAKAAGVEAMVCSASGIAECAAAAAIAAAHAEVWCIAGVHPHNAKDAPADYLARLEDFAAGARNAAIGEIGLDYHYNFSPPDVQRRIFDEQLALARRLGKPAVIHTREAFADTLAALKASGIDGRRIVLHSCTEPPANIREALDFGAFISFSGIVTFNNAGELRQAAKLVPPDRLMAETDAPYLSPEPVRAMKTNEPANVAHVVRALAAARNADPDALAEQTSANAVKFFGLTGLNA